MSNPQKVIGVAYLYIKYDEDSEMKLVGIYKTEEEARIAVIASMLENNFLSMFSDEQIKMVKEYLPVPTQTVEDIKSGKKVTMSKQQYDEILEIGLDENYEAVRVIMSTFTVP